MKNKILKIAKMLKTFTFEDLAMMSDLEVNTINKEIQELLAEGVITNNGKYYEYLGNTIPDSIKIINKNIKSKNSDITVIVACEEFLENCKRKNLKTNTIKAYKSFVNSYVIPYFKGFKLKNVLVSDICDFKNYMQKHKISERRIRNILVMFNQIIKYYQNLGLIDKTCIFEVKRLEKVPKREIQVLTREQIKNLFLITEKFYPYLVSIIKQVILEQKKLNEILLFPEHEKQCFKRKIRKDFYKIKQQLGLTNFMFDDLRFCNIDN